MVIVDRSYDPCNCIAPPREIVLGSYVKNLKSFNIIVMYYSNINEMSCFYFFVFLFLFYIFICI